MSRLSRVILKTGETILNEVEHDMKNYQAEVCRYQPQPNIIYFKE